MIPALPNHLFQNHYVLVFDLTSLQDAGEKVHCPEISGESIRVEMFFDRPLRSVTELIVLGEKRTVLKLISSERLIKMPEEFALAKNFSYFFQFFRAFTLLLSALKRLWVIYYRHSVSIICTK